MATTNTVSGLEGLTNYRAIEPDKELAKDIEDRKIHYLVWCGPEPLPIREYHHHINEIKPGIITPIPNDRFADRKQDDREDVREGEPCPERLPNGQIDTQAKVDQVYRVHPAGWVVRDLIGLFGSSGDGSGQRKGLVELIALRGMEDMNMLKVIVKNLLPDGVPMIDHKDGLVRQVLDLAKYRIVVARNRGVGVNDKIAPLQAAIADDILDACDQADSNAALSLANRRSEMQDSSNGKPGAGKLDKACLRLIASSGRRVEDFINDTGSAQKAMSEQLVNAQRGFGLAVANALKEKSEEKLDPKALALMFANAMEQVLSKFDLTPKAATEVKTDNKKTG